MRVFFLTLLFLSFFTLRSSSEEGVPQFENSFGDSQDYGASDTLVMPGTIKFLDEIHASGSVRIFGTPIVTHINNATGSVVFSSSGATTAQITSSGTTTFINFSSPGTASVALGLAPLVYSWEMNEAESDNKTFTTLHIVPWPGSINVGSPTSIYHGAFKENKLGDPSKTYSIRIYDSTNGNTISESDGQNNETCQNLTFNSISNVTTTPACWEIQMKKDGENGAKSKIAFLWIKMQ